MDEGFELPVLYKNKEIHLPATLLAYGYTYKLQIAINETLVLFERDEEGEWRALVAPDDAAANKNIEPELLQAIVVAIETVLQ